MKRLPSWLGRWLAGCLIALGLAIGAASAAGATAPDPSSEVLVLFRTPPPHFRGDSDYDSGYADVQGRAARKRLARTIAHAKGLTLVTDWPMPVLGLDCYVMQAPPGRSATEVAKELSTDPRVAWAEPMNVYRGQGSARQDPLYAAQPAARLWRLADLHQISTGANVRVAVIDSGVDASHPDLAGQVQVSEDFVAGRPGGAERHGTAVAGVIAAADNGVGIVGVAPGARLLAFRACWQGAGKGEPTVCDTLSLAKALVAAIERRAQVINLSLSGPPAPLLGKLIEVAAARGAAIVAAYDRDLPGGGFPASDPAVVAVADAGPAPAFVYLAPGRDIPVPEPGGRWGLADGSSYAAAHVSGLFALLRQHGPVSRASLIPASTGGGGAIDACASVVHAFGPCACACTRVSEASRR